jgi:hypothetical protein
MQKVFVLIRNNRLLGSTVFRSLYEFSDLNSQLNTFSLIMLI